MFLTSWLHCFWWAALYQPGFKETRWNFRMVKKKYRFYFQLSMLLYSAKPTMDLLSFSNKNVIIQQHATYCCWWLQDLQNWALCKFRAAKVEQCGRAVRKQNCISENLPVSLHLCSSQTIIQAYFVLWCQIKQSHVLEDNQ